MHWGVATDTDCQNHAHEDRIRFNSSLGKDKSPATNGGARAETSLTPSGLILPVIWFNRLRGQRFISKIVPERQGKVQEEADR